MLSVWVFHGKISNVCAWSWQWSPSIACFGLLTGLFEHKYVSSEFALSLSFVSTNSISIHSMPLENIPVEVFSALKGNFSIINSILMFNAYQILKFHFAIVQSELEIVIQSFDFSAYFSNAMNVNLSLTAYHLLPKDEKKCNLKTTTIIAAVLQHWWHQQSQRKIIISYCMNNFHFAELSMHLTHTEAARWHWLLCRQCTH